MEVVVRLSDSFPPDYDKNNQYLAKVHHIIQKYKIEIDASKIYLHYTVTKNEIEELKHLHKEWFPVEYTEKFFNGLINNLNTKTILACYDYERGNKTYKLIIGCLVYEYQFLDHDLARTNCSDLCSDKYGIYIMTFGVINEVRGKGISSMLLNKLFELAKSENNIKYFFLDVVDYNESGRRCYEKNGFIKVYTKKKHYNLFEKRYDALVYCRYVNGGQQPRTAKELFFSCITLCNIPCKIYEKVKLKVKKLSEYERRSIKYKELKV